MAAVLRSALGNESDAALSTSAKNLEATAVFTSLGGAHFGYFVGIR